jgi:hypothetical protein
LPRIVGLSLLVGVNLLTPPFATTLAAPLHKRITRAG